MFNAVEETENMARKLERAMIECEMSERGDTMNSEEMKQTLIDTYINLMRIKACEEGQNKELDYQIKTTRIKLSSFGLDYKDLEY